jgi:hypothetical protein
MPPEQIKRIQGGALILAFYAVIFGLPSAILSRSLLDLLVLPLVFGLPTCYLMGVFDSKVWRVNHDRTKEHTRLQRSDLPVPLRRVGVYPRTPERNPVATMGRSRPRRTGVQTSEVSSSRLVESQLTSDSL